MKPGPELNLRIAREVMGEDVPDGYERVGDHWEKEEPIFEDAKSRCWQIVKWPLDYSGNIAAAWQVVEKMRREGRFVIIEAHGEKESPSGNWGWRCGVEVSETQIVYAYADTAPLAICLAALEPEG